MNESRLVQKVQTAIAEARNAEPDASVSQIVDWLVSHYRPLLDEFPPDYWIRKVLTSWAAPRIRSNQPMKQGRPRLGHPQQMRLVGFENIPLWIPIAPGKRIRLLQATLEDLRKSKPLIRRQLTAQISAGSAELNRLIAFMERYNKMEPGITVRRALELQAATKTAKKA